MKFKLPTGKPVDIPREKITGFERINSKMTRIYWGTQVQIIVMHSFDEVIDIIAEKRGWYRVNKRAVLISERKGRNISDQ
jgi:hypothetical protein